MLNFTTQIRPYVQLARLDKPWGTLLLAWPTLAALALSSQHLPSSPWWIFLIGIVLTRSAGCVVNDYADRWLDHHVSRTKSRPLATGLISPKQAILFFIGLLLCSSLLLLWLPIEVFYGAIVSVVLMCAYPYMKRYINAPQLFLGIVFSQGIPMAYLANHHAFDRTMLSFYLITIFWVVIYDTIYAMNDTHDDMKMQAGSLAIALGRYGPDVVSYAYVILGVLWLVWGIYSNMAVIYYLGLVYLYYNLYQQVKMVYKEAYFQAFLLNQNAGICIGLCIILSCI